MVRRPETCISFIEVIESLRGHLKDAALDELELDLEMGSVGEVAVAGTACFDSTDITCGL